MKNFQLRLNCAGLCVAFMLFLFGASTQAEEPQVQELSQPLPDILLRTGKPMEPVFSGQEPAGTPMEPALVPATMVPTQRVIRSQRRDVGHDIIHSAPQDSNDEPQRVIRSQRRNAVHDVAHIAPQIPNGETKKVIRVYSLKKITGDALTVPEHTFSEQPRRGGVSRPYNPMYTLCIRMLNEAFPELHTPQNSIKIYEIPDKTAVVVFAPQSVQNEVAEMIQEFSEMCKTLQALENEEAKEEFSPKKAAEVEPVHPTTEDSESDISREIQSLRRSIDELRNAVRQRR